MKLYDDGNGNILDVLIVDTPGLGGIVDEDDKNVKEIDSAFKLSKNQVLFCILGGGNGGRISGTKICEAVIASYAFNHASVIFVVNNVGDSDESYLSDAVTFLKEETSLDWVSTHQVLLLPTIRPAKSQDIAYFLSSTGNSFRNNVQRLLQYSLFLPHPQKEALETDRQKEKRLQRETKEQEIRQQNEIDEKQRELMRVQREKCGGFSHCTELQDSGLEFNKVHYLDRHHVICPVGTAVSRFHVDRARHPNLWRKQYECAPVPKQVAVNEHHTPWQDDGGGNLYYLDRHNVECPVHQAIQSFHMERNQRGNQMRFAYNCVLIHGIEDRKKDGSAHWGASGGGNAHYLDRQHVECGGSSWINRFRLTRHFKYQPHTSVRFEVSCVY